MGARYFHIQCRESDAHGIPGHCCEPRLLRCFLCSISPVFNRTKILQKHSGLRSAIHKELVHTGRWTNELGAEYDKLLALREIADYGVVKNATLEEATEALASAERIVKAVHEEKPDLFKISDGFK